MCIAKTQLYWLNFVRSYIVLARFQWRHQLGACTVRFRMRAVHFNEEIDSKAHVSFSTQHLTLLMICERSLISRDSNEIIGDI